VRRSKPARCYGCLPRAQQRDTSIASLSFDERLGMLVDAEQLTRDNRALTRRLKEAKLRLSHACLEDLELQWPPQIGSRGDPTARDLPLGRGPPQHPHHQPNGVGEHFSGVPWANKPAGTAIA
jgi:hypothetical protein